MELKLQDRDRHGVSPKYWGIIPAAGKGVRLPADRPKQYLTLGQRPILCHTLDRIASHPRVHRIFAGISANDDWWTALDYQHERFGGTFVGGGERADTVLAGLDHISRFAQDEDWILVHDAVRPCARHTDISRLIDRVGGDPNGGLLATPIVDTVKLSDDDGRSAQTYTRERLWRAMTPQLFRLGDLRRALETARNNHHGITDEASAMEQIGFRPLLVPCHLDNLKITTPDDLALAAMFLTQQQKEGRG